MRAWEVMPSAFSRYVYFHDSVMHFYGEDRTRRVIALRGC